MDAVLLVSLPQVPGRNVQHSAVAGLLCVCIAVQPQLLHNCTALLGEQVSVPSVVHSPGDKLQDPSSGLFQRRVTEINYCSLKLHKAEF